MICIRSEPTPQLLQTALALYSNDLSGLVLMTDNKIGSRITQGMLIVRSHIFCEILYKKFHKIMLSFSLNIVTKKIFYNIFIKMIYFSEQTVA